MAYGFLHERLIEAWTTNAIENFEKAFSMQTLRPPVTSNKVWKRPSWQVPAIEASTCQAWAPLEVLLPQEILRAMTAGRNCLGGDWLVGRASRLLQRLTPRVEALATCLSGRRYSCPTLLTGQVTFLPYFSDLAGGGPAHAWIGVAFGTTLFRDDGGGCYSRTIAGGIGATDRDGISAVTFAWR